MPDWAVGHCKSVCQVAQAPAQGPQLGPWCHERGCQQSQVDEPAPHSKQAFRLNQDEHLPQVRLLHLPQVLEMAERLLARWRSAARKLPQNHRMHQYLIQFHNCSKATLRARKWSTQTEVSTRTGAFVPGLLAFLMVLLVRERPAAAVAAKSRIEVGPKQFPKACWAYLLATALFGLGNSSNALRILRTQEIGASLVTTTLIYAGFNLVAALVSYPAGFLSDRFGRKGVLLLSFGIFLVAYIGFALAGSIKLIALLFVFYGLYQGMFRSVGKAFASDFVPEPLRASGIAGTAPPWACSNWWPASSPSCSETMWATPRAVFAVVGAGALLVLVPSSVIVSK